MNDCFRKAVKHTCYNLAAYVMAIGTEYIGYNFLGKDPYTGDLPLSSYFFRAALVTPLFSVAASLLGRVTHIDRDTEFKISVYFPVTLALAVDHQKYKVDEPVMY